jgi:long-chain acyl-CoA synthetase
VVLYNNQNAYTTALVVPNKEKLKGILKGQNLSLDTPEGKKAAIEEIKKELDAFNKGGECETMFPHRWLPSTFAVLPEPFTEQNQMINSTMKVVRGKVEKFYAKRIDYMYTSEGKNIYNQTNIDSL